MQDSEILNLWKAYDKKLDESLQINRQNAEDITRMKIQSAIASMKPLKYFTVLTGLLWVGFGSLIVVTLFLNAFEVVSKFFLFSAAIQLLLTGIALWVYLYQLIVIHRVDISQPVLETQEDLARLKSSTLWVARILLLQLPLWTTFYLSEAAVLHGRLLFLIVQGAVTLSFSYVAIWLFLNIKFENREKKWFRLIFDGQEWSPVMKSMDLLKQIHEAR